MTRNVNRKGRLCNFFIYYNEIFPTRKNTCLDIFCKLRFVLYFNTTMRKTNKLYLLVYVVKREECLFCNVTLVNKHKQVELI